MTTETAYYDSRADWSLIPDYMREGVKLYVMHGVPGGSFLCAVFANDLLGAYTRADTTNMRCMENWAKFIYWHTPSNSHGSYEIVDEWIKKGGLKG